MVGSNPIFGKMCEYADDAILHFKSQKQADYVLRNLNKQMQQSVLELYPDKTKIIYCRDHRRQENYQTVKFDFLGYSFQPPSKMQKRTG